MSKFISSSSNSKIKKMASLKLKKFRRIHNKTLIEGIKIIEEAIKENIEVYSVVIDSEKKDRYLYLKNKLNCEFIYVPSYVIKSISHTNNNQGIIAVIKTNEDKPLEIEGDFLLLDNIQDPGNFGAIIRTAVASGFKSILALNCVDKYNDKVIRSSMGAIFKCGIYNVNISEIQSMLISKKNYYLIHTDTRGENLFKFKLTEDQDIGIIIGNEGAGVSDKVARLATHKVTIPMRGNIESLNAAVSASIIMYNLKMGDINGRT